jgi:F-type H+-transporting ATPase subunit b
MLHPLMLAADAVHTEIVPGTVAAAAMPAITALVVFGLLLLILWRTVWPRIINGLDERDAKIRNEIRAAEEAREHAKDLLSEYERNLAKAREEATQMIAKGRADAKAVAEELRARNEAELSDMKARATHEINAAKQAAVSELYAEAANLAAAMAAKILQREISAADQQRLVEESLGELAAVRG